MNLSAFNLIAEHPDHYEVGHPSGRIFKVHKAQLSPIAHEQIRKLADGGQVSSLDQNSSSQPDELSQIQSDVAATPPQNPNESDYDNSLSMQKTLNPGEPDVFQQTSALNQAIADQGAKQVEANRAANDLFSQRQSVEGLNAKRSQLGLDPIPVPGSNDQTQQAPTDNGPQPAPVSDQTKTTQASPEFPQAGQEQALSNVQSGLGQYGKQLQSVAKKRARHRFKLPKTTGPDSSDIRSAFSADAAGYGFGPTGDHQWKDRPQSFLVEQNRRTKGSGYSFRDFGWNRGGPHPSAESWRGPIK